MGVLQQRREEKRATLKKIKEGPQGVGVSTRLRAADLEHADLAVTTGYSDLCPSGLASSPPRGQTRASTCPGSLS